MIELREVDNSCRETMAELLNNENVAKWLLKVPYPYSLEDADTFIEQCRKNKDNPDENLRAVFWNGLHVGGIGLHRDQPFSAEVGYWIGEPYWNKGIATQALLSIVKYGLETMKLQRIFALTYEGNVPSEKVLLKSGFICEGFLRKVRFKNGKGINCKLFALVI